MKSKFYQRIEEAFGPEIEKKIFGVLAGNTSLFDFASVEEFERSSYNNPSHHELVATALNEILGGFGVEALGEFEQGFPPYEYINLGGTYTTTLIYNLQTEKWSVGSWGDIAEKIS